MSYGKVLINKIKIGYYLYSISGNDNDLLYIHNLEIYEKYRGKGLFSELINNIINLAKLNNCKLIMLQPQHQTKTGYFKTTKNLRLLYSKYGFIECKIDKKFMQLTINTNKTI